MNFAEILAKAMNEIQAEEEQLNAKHLAYAAEKEEEASSEQEPAPQPHLMLYTVVDPYGQEHFGMAAALAVSPEDLEESLTAPNMEIIHIFDMEEADDFLKKVKVLKKHFKKLKGLYNET